MVASSSAPIAPEIPPDHDRLPGRLNYQDPEASALSLTSHNHIMSTVQRTGSEGAKTGSEALKPFKVTPEVISQFLEDMNAEEVRAKLMSAEQREELFNRIMEHEEYLKTIHDFNPEDLRRQLDLAGEALNANKKYLEDMKSPEKKGLFHRAWDRMKGFAKDHPIVTALLIAVLAAGGYVGWGYFKHAIMAGLHRFSQGAPIGVLKDGFGAPASIPAAPLKPSGIIDAWDVPFGKGGFH